MRELAPDYKPVMIKFQADPNGASMTTSGILMPDGIVMLTVEAPDSCFALEPKPPEFRKGDWVLISVIAWTHSLQYGRVAEVYSDSHGYRRPIDVLFANEDKRHFERCDLTLIHRCSTTPTGPIRVGSCVRIRVPHGWLGIVSDVDGIEFTVCFADGTRGFYQELHLDHIASPG